VEEQFYLIWPFIILFVNKKYLLPVIISFIIMGIASQSLMTGFKMSSVLTITCFQALGAGALLSWIITFKPKFLKKAFPVMSTIALLAVILILIPHVPVTTRAFVSIITFWLISYILLYHDSEKLKFKFILNNKILIFLGKISYGLYLYHTLVPQLITSKVIDIYLNPYLPNFIYKEHWGELFLFENAVCLLLLAWLSYKFIELPFLKLKNKFKQA